MELLTLPGEAPVSHRFAIDCAEDLVSGRRVSSESAYETTRFV